MRPIPPTPICRECDRPLGPQDVAWGEAPCRGCRAMDKADHDRDVEKDERAMRADDDARAREIAAEEGGAP